MAPKSHNNRDIARALYLSDYPQRDIAARIGVSENTISRWVRDGAWDALRNAQRTSKPSVLRDLYAELAAINNTIAERPQGQQFATPQESLTRSRIVRNIADLEQRYNIGNAVDIGRDFCSFVADTNFDTARQVVNLWDNFLNHLITLQQDGNNSNNR